MNDCPALREYDTVTISESTERQGAKSAFTIGTIRARPLMPASAIAPDSNNSPTVARAEVVEQLERMLAHPLFQRTLRLSLDAFNALNQPGLNLPTTDGMISLRTSAQGARTMEYTARFSW